MVTTKPNEALELAGVDSDELLVTSNSALLEMVIPAGRPGL